MWGQPRAPNAPVLGAVASINSCELIDAHGTEDSAQIKRSHGSNGRPGLHVTVTTAGQFVAFHQMISIDNYWFSVPVSAVSC